jgi:hypothetical protein
MKSLKEISQESCAGNLLRKFRSKRKTIHKEISKRQEKKAHFTHSQPTTIAPSLHIPSHIMQQTAKNITKKSWRGGSKPMKTHQEIS